MNAIKRLISKITKLGDIYKDSLGDLFILMARVDALDHDLMDYYERNRWSYQSVRVNGLGVWVKSNYFLFTPNELDRAKDHE